MKRNYWFGLVLLLLAVSGCGTSDGGPSAASNGPSADGKQYMFKEEPKDGKDVIAVRESAKDGDDVIVVGRIGGEVDPWLKGFAGFRIVDKSLRACSDIPGDACETPWDYCCETDKLATGAALVKFVDTEGNAVKGNAKELLGVKELQTVVVAGKAKRDEAGNLSILAKGIYVRP
ncbi:MAG: hypothetical protein DCC68_22565 [Planctomycetota bacterium]|nr:MAG: hypothetical protein DCC68_22565 [Planctomycetota bacterium]